MGKWTRRAFIGAGVLVGGGLVIGVTGAALAPVRHGLRDEDAENIGQLTTWILITPDNAVTVLIPHCEMGQGAQTALAMMAAEEMDADWANVRVKEAPATDEYANAYIVRAFVNDVPGPFERGFDYGTYRLARWFGLQVTGGSMSVRGTGHHGMRVAGAAAREMLVAAAAKTFGVSAGECTVANSRVTHAASNRSATFGELAKAATQESVPTHPALKDPKSYTLRRKPQQRIDLRSKVDGSAIYGIDYTMPGLLHAAVEIAPVIGGKLVSVDTSAAEKMPGVKKVVQLEEAVAVVADSYWRARTALASLKPQFDDAGHGAVSSASIAEAFDKAIGAAPEMPAAATVIKADYTVPFLPHATMEPMACTARVNGDRAEIWAGTQDPLNARKTAADALGISPENVQYTNLALGGGFGRKLPGNLDFVGMSARIAKAASPAPVKMIWSRETDMQHGYYRPAGMSRFAGALDASGRPVAITSLYAGGGDGESTFMPYAIDDMKHSARDAKHPVRTGPWRSVLNSQHGFFKESFIDEMAHAAKKDPFAFRRDLMTDQPRFKAVLERLAAMANWGSPLPPREGRGIAICESFGSIVGEIAHVSVSPEGVLKVKEVCAVADCGDVVNTDTAAAQLEGGVMFGLSAALLGAVTIKDGKVEQTNFYDFRTMILRDAPTVRVDFVISGAHPGGLGEPGVPPIAAAVTNAIFAATGIRVRELPIKNAKLAATT
ncbi:MAG: molybdopterin-dependent oxidoreductase [Cyanobacteria bacterium]|nr:molybdopterin-dependent oxidoreductase [Cyanobacteriota bacterium]